MKMETQRKSDSPSEVDELKSIQKMNYSLSFFWFRETEVGRGKIKGVNIQYICTFASAALELT